MNAAASSFAPAKINLALHVTGQRADRYHLLDSLVVFADVGDRISLRAASEMSLTVTGPCAAGVPTDATNLCWKAAEAFGETVSITLEKNLPAAAGIGGGSSDAAAVLRAMAQVFGRPVPFDPIMLGADVPVCLAGRPARMQGIGERVSPLSVDPMAAVLVNPGVGLSTPAVFRALPSKQNWGLTDFPGGDVTAWVAQQRNDLQGPAIALRPVIREVLVALQAQRATLARMSGSGATCFGLFRDAAAAAAAAAHIQEQRPEWWVNSCTLGGVPEL